MAEKQELIEQTNLAFDYLQKLFLEVSYLIKEAEAMYRKENIVIGKPGGYAISVRKSQGLESANVDMWLYKKFAVFFVHEVETETKGGQRTTPCQGKHGPIMSSVENPSGNNNGSASRGEA